LFTPPQPCIRPCSPAALLHKCVVPCSSAHGICRHALCHSFGYLNTDQISIYTSFLRVLSVFAVHAPMLTVHTCARHQPTPTSCCSHVQVQPSSSTFGSASVLLASKLHYTHSRIIYDPTHHLLSCFTRNCNTEGHAASMWACACILTGDGWLPNNAMAQPTALHLSISVPAFTISKPHANTPISIKPLEQQ